MGQRRQVHELAKTQVRAIRQAMADTGCSESDSVGELLHRVEARVLAEVLGITPTRDDGD